MEYIYVLKCQKDKYYIGKTFNVNIEYNEHLDGKICEFTQAYKPYDIECIFEADDNFNIYKIISKYIEKYGDDDIGHDEVNNKKLEKYKNKCDKQCCCLEDHWLTECSKNTKAEYWGKMINKVFNNINKNFLKGDICFRCGRYGHEMNSCYAKTHIDGSVLSESDDCSFNDEE